MIYNLGSSPRMRGSPALSMLRASCSGIIPAYAGLTRDKIVIVIRSWDHPRVCGAHKIEEMMTSLAVGSSPRMRGSPEIWILSPSRPGIIPAYAGLTPTDNALSSASRDHPRVCGAHIPMDALYLKVSGSSPRMRGSLGRRAGSVLDGGIIPAYAGLT